MLQRIQTVFFLVAIILLAIPFIGMNLFSIEDPENASTISIYSINVLKKNGGQNNDWWILLIALIVVIGFTIFKFKNRKQQHFLAWIAFVLAMLTPLWFFLGAFSLAENHSVNTNFFMYLLFLPMIFILLGIRGIRKDMKLIDSLNRLR